VCAKTAPLQAGGGAAFVSDVALALQSQPGRKPPRVSQVACPVGFDRKLKRNLRAGAAPVNGTATAAVLCYKTATDAAASPPLTGLTAVGDPAACADVASGQQLALIAGEERAGEPANVAEALGGTSYICLQH
jgi:hypothetical protein